MRNLSLIPRTHVEKPGMLVHSSKLRDGEVMDKADPWGLVARQLSLVAKFLLTKSP